MAMMDLVHVWFRPFRDELSLKRDDGRAAQKRKGRFRRKNGETADVALGRQRQYDEVDLSLSPEALLLALFARSQSSAASERAES